MSDKCNEHQAMVQTIAEMKRDLAHNTALTEDILKCVKGNGHRGLMTQAALNESSIKRAWWWLSAVSVSILGIAAWCMRGSL